MCCEFCLRIIYIYMYVSFSYYMYAWVSVPSQRICQTASPSVRTYLTGGHVRPRHYFQRAMEELPRNQLKPVRCTCKCTTTSVIRSMEYHSVG